MTSIDTKALRELEARAYRAPWGYDTLAFVDGQALLTHTDRYGTLTPDDAALIVALRNQVLPMCDEIDRLREAERAAFNAGYCYGVENDASPEELDCAWELYCRDRREQVIASIGETP